MDKGNTIVKLAQTALVDDKEFLGSIVKEVLQEILNQEFEEKIGAQKYERSEERKSYRNGTYQRNLKTRIGSIKLNIPRDREGNFQTELFNRYQRSEKAFVLTMVEMYLKGVSTRKVSSVVEELCGIEISKSQVSKLITECDGGAKEWNKRLLDKEYTYVLFDATYQKVREGGRVVSKANLIAIGIDQDGYREVIGCQTANGEYTTEWKEFFVSLVNRGLRGVKLTMSDDHPGLKKALQMVFPGVEWQRCQVHYARNFMAKLSRKEKVIYLALLQDIFWAPTKESAMKRAKALVELLREKKKESVADWLEES